MHLLRAALVSTLMHRPPRSNAFASFLDASSHLYMRVCPSVGPSVGLSVRNACAKTKFLG